MNTTPNDPTRIEPAPDDFCQNPKCGRYYARRPNQRFCSTRCKNAYHNAKNRNPESTEVQINKQFKKNEKILWKVFERLLFDPVPRSILEYEGFDFDCCTRTSTSKQTGGCIYWFYDTGWEAGPDSTCLVRFKGSD